MIVRTSGSARTARRRTVLALLAGAAVVITLAVVTHRLAPASLSTDGVFPSFAADPSRAGDGVLDAEDGVVPDGAALSVFDEEAPAIIRLDPHLLEAVRRAATDAAAEEIAFEVNSGWRSAEYQTQLLADAVVTYGSAEEASRWVSTPETSAHVTGDAIDLGPFDATYWLSQNGEAYGLCQTYSNESWHYELRPSATTDGCPAPYLDPTEDPRMRG